MVLVQIWQEDGLDLCLIPYGCVATGPNSGIIEVVKNARTVADVRYIMIIFYAYIYSLHFCAPLYTYIHHFFLNMCTSFKLEK